MSLNGSQNTSRRVRLDGKIFARAGEHLRIRGVTYGPFAPNADGESLPNRERVRMDFVAMRELGINAVRVYQLLGELPPKWFLEMADAAGILVFPGIAWTWAQSFLESKEIQREARAAVKRTAELFRNHDCLFAYNIANEIPPRMVRWYGANRVQKFLAELGDVARQADPHGLVTYANFPPTEYLDTSFLDFATINVYLHDLGAFRRYLFHVQNTVGERPLVLGELGMDTFRHGEEEQAAFLKGHLKEATLMGLAGSFVFSWTDEWHTGGAKIEDWAFGITRADRTPKLACKAVAEVYKSSPAQLLPYEAPKVSVVVCSYNGGRTLDQCLASLMKVDYPNYEVILVDDGSTDNSQEIAAKYPKIINIKQTNHGLSYARNVGLYASTGAIVAYTDSDCFVDPHWITHLVYQLLRGNAVAVGGPNLTPDDGWTTGCVAASPGQPTHVLESDECAEHIPGCNMAYRREALEAIQGFNPRYRRAGDDVDVCWRLQKRGHWITFAPGAFVWHHRRTGPRAYLKQQGGYGEAEGLLWFDHPDKFNSRGDSVWHGHVYGGGGDSLHFGQPVIYHGIWGSSLFQTLYQPGAAHAAIIPSTLEWHLLAALFLVSSIALPRCLYVAASMFLLSVLVALTRAAQAPLVARYESLRARLLIAALCYAQPLVRSWRRYRTRFAPSEVPKHLRLMERTKEWATLRPRFRWILDRSISYWDEEYRDPIVLLTGATSRFAKYGWPVRVDPGWDNWDLEIFCGPWTTLRLYTTQELHPKGKSLLRVRYVLRANAYLRVITAVGILATAVAARLPGYFSLVTGGGFAVCLSVAWWYGSGFATRATRLVDTEAKAMGLTRLDPGGRGRI